MATIRKRAFTMKAIQPGKLKTIWRTWHGESHQHKYILEIEVERGCLSIVLDEAETLRLKTFLNQFPEI